MRKPNSDFVALGRAIRFHRKKAKMTQAQLAVESRLDEAYISNLECGRMNATVLTISIVAKALGTTSQTIWADAGL